MLKPKEFDELLDEVVNDAWDEGLSQERWETTDEAIAQLKANYSIAYAKHVAFDSIVEASGEAANPWRADR